MPRIILGDFNTARFLDEKMGGSRLTFSKVESFNQFIDDCSLSDIRSSGNYWSCHNSSTGIRRIMVRLDRVLCNEAWINLLPESCYEYQPQATSDHVPLWLKIYPAPKGGPKPFRFF